MSETQNQDRFWERHTFEWRDSVQITSQWREAGAVKPQLLAFDVRGKWWETLESLRVTLLVTREYEHLVVALNHDGYKATITFQPMPHPSGVVVDRKNNVVYFASTRNPNQVYDFEPVTGHLARGELSNKSSVLEEPLVPVRTRFYPGCMYLHDLAIIDGSLYANAVAHNAVVRLGPHGDYRRVWWPRCIEKGRGPDFSLNYLQLNSIAAGKTISKSFFSASTERISRRRPGHKNFPVDKRGVIFSGSTREPLVRGLTRPHSARLFRDRLWADNSGYGEFGYAEGDRFVPIAKLPGWTRGLCFTKNIAFVGTSRIIPRFRQYAPGIEAEKCLCGIHAVDIDTGRIIGSLIWPYGSQVFAIDWIDAQLSKGFPFRATGRRATAMERQLFYSFETRNVRDIGPGRKRQ